MEIKRPYLPAHDLSWLKWYKNIKVIALDANMLVEREASFSHGEDAAHMLLVWRKEFPIVRVTNDTATEMLDEFCRG